MVKEKTPGSWICSTAAKLVLPRYSALWLWNACSPSLPLPRTHVHRSPRHSSARPRITVLCSCIQFAARPITKVCIHETFTARFPLRFCCIYCIGSNFMYILWVCVFWYGLCTSTLTNREITSNVIWHPVAHESLNCCISRWVRVFSTISLCISARVNTHVVIQL